MTVNEWTAQVRVAVGMIEHASDTLANLPPPPDNDGEDDAARLAALNQLWASLNVDRPTPGGIFRRADAFAARLKQEIEQCHSALRGVLRRVREQQHALIVASVEDPAHRVIRLGDFAGGLLHIAGNDKVFLGDIARLPPNHFGRSLLPEADMYHVGINGRALVLGERQDWYEAAQVKQLTSEWSQGQRIEREEEARKAALREQQDRERRERDPDYRLVRLEEELAAAKKRLAEMEARGAKRNARATANSE